MVGSLLAMVAEEVRPFFSEDACNGWGTSMQAVAEKRGWASPDGVPELALAAATLGMGVPSFIIVRSKLTALREYREREQAARLAGKGATSVVDTSAVPAAAGAGDGG
jgi:hypothetical protein